ncbi:MAG: deoxynucleoside kinase [Deltaproteobacteria bacterium]|nr:deoxynucleoside kinase [Deltaproteobacteria bacterium]MCB9478107.1 deoxynucleoside kinase [Deltaproteobacteria bacterium]MCB9487603.1 deoxynucleoside kinase [Deltaproteobacteria bacterium]
MLDVTKDAALTRKPRYIVVEGPIGVGKSSLVRKLGERLDARMIFEQVDENPFLEGFYKDSRKYAFQTQLFFLLSRFQQQRELAQQDLFAQNTVSDYLFAKDKIFAYLNLSEHELALYERIYRMFEFEIVKPDLVVFLVAHPKVLLKRIRVRNHAYERRLGIEYLDQLTEAYSKFFFAYDESPLLVVNTSEIDFVNNPEHFDALLTEIDTHTRGTKHFIPLGSG